MKVQTRDQDHSGRRTLLLRGLTVGLTMLLSAVVGARTNPDGTLLWLLNTLFVCTITWTVANWLVRIYSELKRIFIFVAITLLLWAIWHALSLIFAPDALWHKTLLSVRDTQSVVAVLFVLATLVSLLLAWEKSTMTNRPIFLMAAELTKLNKDSENQFKRYEQARGDLRSYATLLIQVVALFVTTTTIAVGWFATSFYSDQRKMTLELSGYSVLLTRMSGAQGASYRSNTLGSEISVPTSADTTAIAQRTAKNTKSETRQSFVGKVSQAEMRRLLSAHDEAEKRFGERVLCSAGTAAILCVFSLIASVMVCTSCAMGFMIGTARQRAHHVMRVLEATGWVRTEGGDEATDRCLTYRLIIAFAALLWIACYVLTLAACRSAIAYVSDRNMGGYSSLLLALCALSLAKFLFCSFTVARYSQWEYRQHRHLQTIEVRRD